MTDRLCIVCQTTHTPDQTCQPCLGRTRRTLIRIEQLYALLPYELAGRAGASLPMDPSGIRGETEPMPGGDILVMLGPGSTAWHAMERDDVDSVPGVLERWDTDWRITLAEPAATEPATVTGCVLYLLRRLTTAAQRHPAFDEFADDMRVMRDRLELALRISPQRSPVPCLQCGTRTLERPMPRDDGRAFEWQCARCHLNYNYPEWLMAARQAEVV